jgi:hypothetical protein
VLQARRTGPVREMACDHGYHVHVVARRHAMALDEVMDYVRWIKAQAVWAGTQRSGLLVFAHATSLHSIAQR